MFVCVVCVCCFFLCVFFFSFSFFFLSLCVCVFFLAILCCCSLLGFGVLDLAFGVWDLDSQIKKFRNLEI